MTRIAAKPINDGLQVAEPLQRITSIGTLSSLDVTGCVREGIIMSAAKWRKGSVSRRAGRQPLREDFAILHEKNKICKQEDAWET